MGEAKRMREQGMQFKQLRPGEQIQVDLRDSTPLSCSECGCRYFLPMVMVHIISPLMSPTGQELVAQQPVLVCSSCRKGLKVEGDKP